MKNAFESVCNRTLRDLDAFIDRELDERAASVVQQHVAQCRACSRELDLRNKLRSRLRSASRSGPEAPFLQTRVLATLRQNERRSSMWLQRSAWASATAATLVLAVGLSIAYQLGHLRFTVASQNQYLDSLLVKVSLGLRPGLSNHVHCAVFRRYSKQPPAIEALRADLPQEYKQLLEVVRSHVPPEYAVHMAHECSFRDRTYIHIALKSDSNLLSLVLTRRVPGETLAANELTPVVSRGGLSLYGAAAQRFQVSGFETPQHFAYLVSDVSAAETHRMMLAVGPEVRAFLARMPA